MISGIHGKDNEGVCWYRLLRVLVIIGGYWGIGIGGYWVYWYCGVLEYGKPVPEKSQ